MPNEHQYQFHSTIRRGTNHSYFLHSIHCLTRIGTQLYELAELKLIECKHSPVWIQLQEPTSLQSFSSNNKTINLNGMPIFFVCIFFLHKFTRKMYCLWFLFLILIKVKQNSDSKVVQKNVSYQKKTERKCQFFKTF